MIKKTPLYDVHLKYGADMREIFGYYLPLEYSQGAKEEHIRTRQNASLCDVDFMPKFTIGGDDAGVFLQYLLTRDISNQSIGRIKYTAMCYPEGTMVDDGTVWKFDENRFLYIGGSEDDFTWMTENSENHNVDLKNISSVYTLLALQGPKSKDILAQITDINLDTLQYFHFQEGQVVDERCLVARIGYTGEFGYEIHCNPSNAEKIWTTIMDVGEEFGIVPCGIAAIDSLRQEAGYLLIGSEFDAGTNPLEVGLGWTINFGKGDFVGRKVLLSISAQGVKRRLVWFKIPSGEVMSKGNSIFIDKMRVGEITCGSFSPTFNRGTAMGFVLPEFVMPGVEFEIKNQSKHVRAILSEKPLYDPGDERTRGDLG
jgi:aminomethyltransferase